MISNHFTELILEIMELRMLSSVNYYLHIHMICDIEFFPCFKNRLIKLGLRN